MAEKIKAKVVETEEKSLQEKEQEVQKNSGFDEESGMYKVDLTQPPKKDEDAVQEQETEDSLPSGSVKAEEAGEETEVGLQEVRQEEEVEEVSKETEEETILEEITNEEDTTDDTGVDGSDEVAEPAPEQEEILQENETQEKIENELFKESESLIPEMNELKELREKFKHPRIQDAIKHARRAGEWD